MSIENLLVMSDNEPAPVIDVGYLVVPKTNIPDPFKLISPKVITEHTAHYGFAIVVSMAPFVLVSERADMRWETTVLATDFIPIGRVNANAMIVCNTRLLS